LPLSSARVGAATRELFASWFPRPLAPLVRAGVHALLDPPLREAFGFPAAPRVVRRLVPAGMALRRRALRLLPPRRTPRLRTEGRHRSYPEGYTIEALGPPKPEGPSSAP